MRIIDELLTKRRFRDSLELDQVPRSFVCDSYVNKIFNTFKTKMVHKTREKLQLLSNSKDKLETLKSWQLEIRNCDTKYVG